MTKIIHGMRKYTLLEKNEASEFTLIGDVE